MDIKNYIEQNKDRFLEELFSLIRIPSISSIEAHKPDMIRCAQRWKEYFKYQEKFSLMRLEAYLPPCNGKKSVQKEGKKCLRKEKNSPTTVGRCG